MMMQRRIYISYSMYSGDLLSTINSYIITLNIKSCFDLLIEMCKEGLNKLMLTYTNSDKINIIHTLQLYKIMLEKPELCATNDLGIPSASAFDKAGLGTNSNIDDIFSKIVNIYSVEEFSIIHNVLLLIKNVPEMRTIPSILTG